MKIKVTFSILRLIIIVMLAASCKTDRKDNQRETFLPVAIPDDQIELLPGPFKDALDRAASGLLTSYDPDRFLAWLRPLGGLEPRAEKYMGWETWVTGHSLGHYLSGCSMAYIATGNPEFKQRSDYIIEELALIQEASGSGFIAKQSDKAVFENEISRGIVHAIGFKLNDMSVPFYVYHKILSGLRDAYRLTGNHQALEVEKAFADWIYDQVMHLSDDLFQQLLKCEHGGIAESFADLFADTGEKKYLDLSIRFFDHELMEPIYAGKNNLPGLHANTQIPKYIALARIYQLTGSEREKTTASNFWSFVTGHHSYITGGNSYHEHFGPPDKLNDYLGHMVTETCNTYNMLKLSKHIFTWNPVSQVADYMERAMLNHSLASQNPDNGHVTYFLSLQMPAHREFNDPHSFTCCVGSGMEHHFLYPGLIYFQTEDALYINQFIASKLNWSRKGVEITQESSFPSGESSLLTIHCNQPEPFGLLVRKPHWTGKGFMISINGKPVNPRLLPNGYYSISRTWKNGDQIKIDYPFTLRLETMPDNNRRVAVFNGPVLLGGDLGPIGTADAKRPDFVPVLLAGNNPVETWVIPDNREEQTFVTRKAGDPRDVALKPFYRLYDRYHTVYWDMFDSTQWATAKSSYLAKIEGYKDSESRTIDTFRPGEMQPERDHKFTGINSEVAEFEGIKGRIARSGMFSFEMKVLPDKPVVLVNTYWGNVDGSLKATFDVLVENTLITTQIIHWHGGFFDVSHELPAELTRGKSKVTVTFRSGENFQAGPLCGVRTIRLDDDLVLSD
jgi:uncharacterized protein